MSKRLTIYDIKYLLSESNPHFFSRETMKFFGQTMKDFKAYKQEDGRYFITAPRRIDGKTNGRTEMYFNPKTNSLEFS